MSNSRRLSNAGFNQSLDHSRARQYNFCHLGGNGQPEGYRANSMCDTKQQNRIAVAVLALVSSFAGCSQSRRLPQIVGPEEWPPAMRDLLEQYPQIANSITTYDHDAFIDSKFTWKISAQADVIERFIDDLNLTQTTTDHVKYKELQRSIPDGWILPSSKQTMVYVSEGYGDEYLEGANLLLLVRDPTAKETVVLYEWIF
ncbi:MAG: hypothetical protein AAF497_10355 [Planctomycetota bacterium]